MTWDGRVAGTTILVLVDEDKLRPEETAVLDLPFGKACTTERSSARGAIFAYPRIRAFPTARPICQSQTYPPDPVAYVAETRLLRHLEQERYAFLSRRVSRLQAGGN